MDIERLKELEQQIKGMHWGINGADLHLLYDLLPLADEDIARKTETTSCEWCEVASECEYEVTFFRDDDRRATRRSLMPKFCPNCGRRLKEEQK